MGLLRIYLHKSEITIPLCISMGRTVHVVVFCSYKGDSGQFLSPLWRGPCGPIPHIRSGSHTQWQDILLFDSRLSSVYHL